MITNFFLHLIQYLILIAVTAFLLYGVFRVWVDIVTTCRLNRFLKENMDVLQGILKKVDASFTDDEFTISRILNNADDILMNYRLRFPFHRTPEGIVTDRFGMESLDIENGKEGDLDD